GQSSLIINNQGSGDLFTASQSGTTEFTIAHNGNITANGTLLTLGNGSNSTIQTTGNAALNLISSGNGNIVLGQNAGNGTILINPNAGGQSSLIINNLGLGDLLTASASGITQFT